MIGESKSIISFGEFELDTIHRHLLQDGETIALHAKAFDLLTFLVQNNGRIVSKEEILNTVWEGNFVEESNLVVQISNLRKTLGETKNSPRFLVTIPGKGYQFVANTNEKKLIIGSHTVSELKIEHEEKVIEQKLNLPKKEVPKRKWLVVAAIFGLLILTTGTIGFWSSQQIDAKKNLAFSWVNQKAKIETRQLTAKGNLDVAAISPDGTLYAFTNEGSERSGLWVAGINGSKEIEVIPPTSINFNGLTFSPDGLFIYYVARDEKNRQSSLFRVPTFGGLSEKILKNVCCSPTFSPDGKRVGFVRIDSEKKQSAMIIANVKDQQEKEISVRPLEFGFNDNGASWSPDGTKIAVGGKEEKTGENVLLMVDVETGKVTKFGEKPWTYIRRVEWMPDGSGILLNVIEKDSWQERQIWLLEYPSGNYHRITNGLNRYGRETVSVSADGTKLLAVSAQTISNIFVGPADDLTQLKQITNNAVGKSEGAFNSLTWTSDNRLVFMRFFDKSNTLWAMNADGTNTQQLTSNASLDRKPSVVNNQVVFQSIKSGKFNIWSVGLDGKDLKQITFDGGGFPSVTPDGNWIFYQNNGFIWKVSINGGTPIQMTFKASKSAEVSPDGKMFACFYRLSKDDKLKLAVFPIEGGELLHLFDVSADLPYEKLRWTPDNQSLVYAFYNSTAWKQKLSGGAAEKFFEFPGEIINAFAWSSNGKQFAVAHGQELRDVVLFAIKK